ncbi:MAG: hypothetical protein JXL81_14235 [Deltaproteobacteria bacterium]|nr:hypothetical protein [Deltaproteobacteria bacterium]
MAKLDLVKHDSPEIKERKCLACGKAGINARRRYCSNECRKQIMWVLSLSRGLLSIFNARYASFSFNRSYVILDILPVWSKEISRFTHRRTIGKKPADDLKTLILDSGSEWYSIIGRNNSRSYASLSLLQKNSNSKLSVRAIRPDSKKKLRFSKAEKESIKCLKLKLEELISEEKTSIIKSAYKRMARIHHPDMGGSSEEFRKVKDAHEQMLMWAQNPQYTSRKALLGCWSYDASTDKWAPPL